MPKQSPTSARLVRHLASGLYAQIIQRLWGVDLRRVFDAAFYLDHYPDVARSGLDPLGHFLLYGAREGRSPHPLFDAAFYLANNPDVARSGQNPLIHYLRSGWKEDRRPSPFFNPAYYREANLLPNGVDALAHYLECLRGGRTAKIVPDLADYLAATGAAAPYSAPGGVIDVVVPVYRGLEETRACVESIFGAVCRNAFELILVNDCSPDPALAGYLRTVASSGRATLIENERNLGFAGSVNAGIRLHTGRDVVLLNSDTLVANDWLDRLCAAAHSAARTGTATSFTNNGTICSYPQFCRDNPVPEDAAALDALMARVNAGMRVEIPTAVGFCMYIRRDCLVETGLFDTAEFGEGYGEENDFCMRARDKGWRHVLAADVFVAHTGSVSFAVRAGKLRAAAQERLSARHPEYDELVRRHVQRDPAGPRRVAAAAAQMRESGRPVILHVTHRLGGGVDEYIDRVRDRTSGRAEMLALAPDLGGLAVLRNPDPAAGFAIWMNPVEQYGHFLDLLRSFGVTRIHVQHAAGHKLDIRRLIRDLGVPFDFTAHDYFAICPQITLSDGEGRYCGEPDAAGCNRCLEERPCGVTDIGAWRRTRAWMVTEADRVLAPSLDTAARFERYFPGARIITAAHPETAPAALLARRLSGSEPLRIAVLGAMPVHKGSHNLYGCASIARKSRLPLEFILIGEAEDCKAPFRQTGRYRNPGLPRLLAEVAPHLVWFPARWPETYSFTLSACLEFGLPVAAPRMGAFPERLAGREWSWLLPADLTPRQWIDFFLGIRADHFIPHTPPKPVTGAARIRDDFYDIEYVKPVIPGGAAPQPACTVYPEGAISARDSGIRSDIPVPRTVG